jgi:protein RecA
MSISKSNKGKDVVRNDKSLDMALDRIHKDFGKGSIMWLGDRGPAEGVEVIPTGNLAIDMALGIGGIPRGRIIEIFGPEMSGKTTLTLHIIAEAQKQGGRAAFIDAEHALDPSYATRLGVDIDNLLISQPDSGEQALEITDILVKSGALSVIVIDSVAALVPRAELEGDMGDVHVGLQARLMSQALRKLTSSINSRRAAVSGDSPGSILPPGNSCTSRLGGWQYCRAMRIFPASFWQMTDTKSTVFCMVSHSMRCPSGKMTVSSANVK